ncbi:hypothetical protein ACLB1G_11690 [Oxalobacteraceae bacterium A2-2]
MGKSAQLDPPIIVIDTEMNTAAKLYDAMCAKPDGWRLHHLQTVAHHWQVVWRQHGSHCIFVHPRGASLSVPAHGVIKPVYVKKFVIFVKGV